METLTPRRHGLDNTTRPRLNRSKKVRVVAKIRGFTDLEAGPANWATVRKPQGDESDAVTVSFGDDQSSSRKESYKLDYCYEQNEGNEMIFAREVKPLIEGVFDGLNATVIAYGARGSGKTRVIQGSDKEPGLAVLAVAEILYRVEEIGRSISISVYEISQDHVYDLLDPKRPAVPVKSISEFEKLYLAGYISCKPMQKIANECTHRSHKGLIVHLSSPSETVPMCKMNFVDLAGYEDARRKSSEGLNLIESTKVNKSIYALLNVVYALNANENHVPYRESKLTRLLQDSLGGKSRILMLTCLNPSFCQDSAYMMSLASRSCQGVYRTVSETAKKTKSSTRPMVLSSPKMQLTGSVSTSRKPQMQFSIKKANGVATVIKQRKLFDEASHLTKSEKKSEKASFSSDIASAIGSSVQQEDSSPLRAINPQETIVLDKSSVSVVPVDTDSASDSSPLGAINPQETVVLDKEQAEENHGEVTPAINNSLRTLSEESQNIDKENFNSLINKDESPLISTQLQKISENLKSLMSSTPICIEFPPNNDTLSKVQALTDIEEPKTPIQSIGVSDRCELGDMNSPWEKLNMCGSEVKKSYVQNYLRLLNTGSKEQLKSLKGIGEKRASSILKLREESPEPFKELDDLKAIKLSAKQITKMMKMGVGDIFN
ncbi:hypothetical protein JRO89_XS11G0197700 [Xanthoceras sorbifolium]|uniref:Kinesin motor domain-containing protein n=1 Tax=Xanthoceras sorbifolium TaxID=99658 RepID=A0ABQ8HGE1_9ROSI|nr:hypothetical protein JRO89_XS11G0197700 [Xanthoceras sorbifolium]